MEWLRRALADRRVLIAGGMALALLAGLGVAAIFMFRDGDPPEEVASGSGLVVQTGRPDDVKMDPQRPLRCFVDGKSIGEIPLRDCAQKNGVATGALDVGLDQSGSLAAATGPTSDVTPLPPSEAPDTEATTPRPEPADDVVRPAPVAPPRPVAAAAGPAGCWRYGDGGWSRLTDDMPLPACIEALYAGQCEPAGSVAYGRWGARTLRLAGGAVQVSDDNRSFRVLVTQGPGCSIPPPAR
jgi:hypothetical protein